MKHQFSGPSLQHAQHHYQEGLAENYEAKRRKKAKWALEHQWVERVLVSDGGGVKLRVLDVPVGTGRFLQLYKDLGLEAVGIDYNQAMLDCARAKHPDAMLDQGDITMLQLPDKSFDIVVCVRLIHLVTPREVTLVLRELFRVARSRVIVSANITEVASSKGRSQNHTMKSILACVNPPWRLDLAEKLLDVDAKLGPYYMFQFRCD